MNMSDNTTQTDPVEPVEDSKEEPDISSNTTLEIDLNRRLQEFRGEQEDVLHNLSSTIAPQKVEEDILSLSWDLADFNFMERYMIIDLPWHEKN